MVFFVGFVVGSSTKSTHTPKIVHRRRRHQKKSQSNCILLHINRKLDEILVHRMEYIYVYKMWKWFAPLSACRFVRINRRHAFAAALFKFVTNWVEAVLSERFENRHTASRLFWSCNCRWKFGFGFVNCFRVVIRTFCYPYQVLKWR